MGTGFPEGTHFHPAEWLYQIQTDNTHAPFPRDFDRSGKDHVSEVSTTNAPFCMGLENQQKGLCCLGLRWTIQNPLRILLWEASGNRFLHWGRLLLGLCIIVEWVDLASGSITICGTLAFTYSTAMEFTL